MKSLNFVCIVLAACAAAASPRAAAAEDFPSRPVRIVVPFPAGGPVDVVTRQMAERVARRLRQPVVVDNRSGAQGNIGAENVARAAADGHTLLSTAIETHVNNVGIFRKLPFDPERDFTPILETVSLPVVLACNARNVPVSDLKGLVSFARAHRGKLAYGSWGNGGVAHLLGEALNRKYQLDMTHVPYKGGAPLAQDLVGGQIACAFQGVSVTAPYVEQGILKVLGVTGHRRVRAFPAVPTLAEQGLDDPVFATRMWFGLYAPARTPGPVVARLQREFAAVLAEPDLVRILADQAYDVEAGSSADFARRIKADQAVMLQLIDDLKIEKQ